MDGTEKTLHNQGNLDSEKIQHILSFMQILTTKV